MERNRAVVRCSKDQTTSLIKFQVSLIDFKTTLSEITKTQSNLELMEYSRMWSKKEAVNMGVGKLQGLKEGP